MCDLGSRIRILERHDNNVSVEGCNFVYDQMKSTRLISTLSILDVNMDIIERLCVGDLEL